MKQVLIRQGRAEIADIPAPLVEPGTVLVRTLYSCISAGTELSGVRASATPIWKRALQKPGGLKQAWAVVQREGVKGTLEKVQQHSATGQPTGYSAAGRIMEVGAEITDLLPGATVACAGAQCAFHAEYISVPRNLVVPVPDGVDPDLASTVTLGAIALQGIRRAQPTLGESFVVLGLGILGQLCAQLLKANGCRVIGVDLDPRRVALAESLGMDCGLQPDQGDDLQNVARLTDGFGADGVLITAATPSDLVVSTAFKMCRKKGRVVLVGDVGLHLNRADFYEKELDFFISTSYGPGRYDRRYEEAGLDYPLGYVRWTENRNMAEYLRLVAEKKLRIRELIGATFPIDQATDAYETLRSNDRPLIALLSYPVEVNGPPQRTIAAFIPASKATTGSRVRLALIGAGGFAKAMHLPNLKALRDKVELRAVMSRTGHNAMSVAREHGAAYATTDYTRVLEDKEIDAVLIATRHNTHAALTLAALQAGKHVLVEKPLAITRSELDSISAFFENDPQRQKPILLTGFNRRFSPFAKRIREMVQRRTNPMIINYRMNAGYLPLDHWVHGPEGGGRNIGEACHIYDLFTFLTDARVQRVRAEAIKPHSNYYNASDNFSVTITYDEGSVAVLTYSSMGTSDFPKETMEIFFEGQVISMSEYKILELFGNRSSRFQFKTPEKGQKEELFAFVQSVTCGCESPIQLWEQIQSMAVAFDAEQLISRVAGLP